MGHFDLLRRGSFEDVGLKIHPPSHADRLEAVALGAANANLAFASFLHLVPPCDERLNT